MAARNTLAAQATRDTLDTLAKLAPGVHDTADMKRKYIYWWVVHM